VILACSCDVVCAAYLLDILHPLSTVARRSARGDTSFARADAEATRPAPALHERFVFTALQRQPEAEHSIECITHAGRAAPSR